MTEEQNSVVQLPLMCKGLSAVVKDEQWPSREEILFNYRIQLQTQV